MKISVIVTNYNHSNYITQAVKSILKQTYENFELIIVDDCSTDNSHGKIIELTKLDKRILKPIFIKQNTGKWNAINRGIMERATGSLITTQDADDSCTSQRLELQLKCLKEMGSYHTLCGFTNCGNQEEINNAEKYFINDSKLLNDLDVISHSEVLKMVHKGHKTTGINHYYTGVYETHGASALFYKQLWENGMKFLPGNLGLRCQKAEDSDFNTKMTLLLQKTSVLKMPLYCYRRGTTTNPAYLESL